MAPRSRKRNEPASGNEPAAGTPGGETNGVDAGGSGAAPPDGGSADPGAGTAQSEPAASAAPGTGADPQEAAGPEAPKRKRGRPSNAEKAARAKADEGLAVGISEEDATNSVAGLYAMLNALTARPGPDGTVPPGPFMYGVQNAAVIGKEVANVSRYYNLSVDGPVLSVFKLGVAVAMVNVPIMAMFAAQRSAARAARASQPASPEDVVFANGGDGTAQRPPMDFTGENTNRRH